MVVWGVLAASACGLSVRGADPNDTGPLDDASVHDDGPPTNSELPSDASDDADASASDASDDADADVPCAKRALLLVDKSPTTANAMTSLLTGAGFTVSSIADYSQSNGENVATFDPHVIVILAGVNYGLDITGPLQTAVKNALGAGAGLMTEEWAGYQIKKTRFQTIAPYILFDYETYTDADAGLLHFTKTEEHPIWNGLPTTFTTTRQPALGLGKPRGSTSKTIANATYKSFPATPAVLVQDDGTTRIAETTIAVDYYNDDSLSQDANIERLFLNMTRWAARCDTPP